MAPYLMHWQAMLDAKKLGLKFYDFWGIETASGATPGFVRFKLGFCSAADNPSEAGIREYAGAYDLVNNRVWYFIYKWVRRINLLIKKSSI